MDKEEVLQKINELKQRKTLTAAEAAELRELLEERKKFLSELNAASQKQGYTVKENAGRRIEIKTDVPPAPPRQRIPVAARNLDTLSREFGGYEVIDNIDRENAVIVTGRDGRRQVWANPHYTNYRDALERPYGSVSGDADHVYSKARARQQGYGYVLMEDVPKGPNRSAGTWEKHILELPTERTGTPDIRYADPAQRAKLENIRIGGRRARFPGLSRVLGGLRKIPIGRYAAPAIAGIFILRANDAHAATQELMTPNTFRLQREWPDAPYEVWQMAAKADSVGALDPTAAAAWAHEYGFNEHLRRNMPEPEFNWNMRAVDITPRERQARSLMRKGPAGMAAAKFIMLPSRIEDAWDENVAEPLSENWEKFTDWLDNL